MSALEPVCAAVLAGGRSTRFGSEKALALLAGRTLLEHALQGFFSRRPLVARVAVVARPQASEELRLAAGHAEAISDSSLLQTPLAGLEAALAWAPHELLIVSAVDTPLFSSSPLVDALLSQLGSAAAIAPSLGGILQPLCAVYRRGACLPVARQLLGQGGAGGPRALLELVSANRCRYEDLFPQDPDAFALRDTDTREDLAQLERQLAAR